LQTNTNNLNNTCASNNQLGVDEPNIVFMRKSQRTIQYWTQNVNT